MAQASVTWVDGKLASTLPLPDRGVDFGDGLFETLLLDRGRPLHLEAHLSRLTRGLQRLKFPPVTALAQTHLLVACAAIAQREVPWCAVRLTVTRGAGERGYAPSTNPRVRVICSATPLARDCAELLPPAALDIASWRWSTQPQLAGVKHLNRLDQVMVAQECQASGSDEMLVLDQNEQVVGVNTGNVFFRFGDRLMTPSLHQCGIHGTRRALIIETLAPALGLSVMETDIAQVEISSADEVFYSNSLIGLRPVKRCGATHWTDYSSCHALFQRYRQSCQ